MTADTRPYAPSVLYTGVALAGCQTSLRAIAVGCDPKPTDEQLRSLPCEVRWRSHQLRLMQEYYSNLWVPRLVDALHELPRDPKAEAERKYAYDGVAHWNRLVPGWRELAVFLRSIEGAVFVVDSQRERVEAGTERLEHFVANLRDCAREPAEVAVVFQFNKRDLPNAADTASLKTQFRWPGPVAYVESIAPKGIGVSETLDALLALVASARR